MLSVVPGPLPPLLSEANNQSPMWKLVIEDDEGKRTVVPLTRDDYTIGRKEGNTIRLTERNVSRDHAKVHKTNGTSAPAAPPQSGYYLEDLDSYNGVYVNGLRVAQPQELQHGDLIQIGDYRIIMQDDALVEGVAPGPGGTTQDMKSTVPTGVMNRAAMLMERPNRLVMLAGPTPGAEYPLTDERVTIGRAEDATISVNHNSVSRLHCEIHSLGEGRYEIVDKGSSNGVRINASELRRSIIEPGDVIELGDVRFRFVGAGQIFLPGVGDSQQLEAISDRPPGSYRAAERKPGAGLIPWILLGVVLAGGLVAGVAIYQERKSAPGPDGPVPSAIEDPEQLALEAAKQLCDDGKCDVAHDKLMVGIADESPLRKSTDFQNIETKWADSLLDRADKETDPVKKRSLLHQVEATDTVPESRRNIATSKLAELDAAQSTNPTATEAPTETAPTTTATHTVPTTTATHTVPTATATHTVPTATATHVTHRGSVAGQARELILAGKISSARALLEPRVFSGKATPDERNLLYGICKGVDKQCTDAIKKAYP